MVQAVQTGSCIVPSACGSLVTARGLRWRIFHGKARTCFGTWSAASSLQTAKLPIEMVGVNDTFGESGSPMELMTKYGIDTQNVVAAALKAISRK